MKPAKRTKKYDPLDAFIQRIPEDQRTATIRAAIACMGGSLKQVAMERCPVCDEEQLPVEYSHGTKRCRNCCYCEELKFTPAEKAEAIDISRRWMISAHRPIAAGAV